MRGLIWGLVLLFGASFPFLAFGQETDGQGWRKLTTEAEVLSALDDRFLQYEIGKQWFYKSGKTLYDSGRPSWGNWRPRGGQYCSEWPPNANWSCYDLFVSTDGKRVRFQGHGSDITDGVYGPFDR